MSLNLLQEHASDVNHKARTFVVFGRPRRDHPNGAIPQMVELRAPPGGSSTLDVEALVASRLT